MGHDHHRVYDVDRAVREVRSNMTGLDAVSISVRKMARDLADGMIHQFTGRDLTLVAETMIVNAASIGVLATDNFTRATINIQCIAAVYVLDHVAEQSAD